MDGVPSGSTQLKRCSKCSQEKPLAEFYRSKRNRSGFEGQCKDCKRAAARARYHDPASAPRERARQWNEANPGMKRCSGCGEVKLVSEFYRSSRDGLKSRCKACQTESKKDYMPAYLRAYYQRHREELKAAANRYYAGNTEHVKARVREYQRANPEANRQKVKRWQKDNRARRNEYLRVRRHKKRSNGGSFTIEEWLALCTAFDFRCACCGVPEQTVDHIIPVTKGGGGDISNIQPLCRRCNSSKGVKVIDYRSNKQARGGIPSTGEYQ